MSACVSCGARVARWEDTETGSTYCDECVSVEASWELDATPEERAARTTGGVS